MPVFYYDAQVFKVYQIKQILDDANIPCVLKNDFAQGAIGESSPLDSAPEVWLIDESWRTKAQQLVDDFILQQASLPDELDWQCRQCHEENDANFGICWSCQTVRA